MKSLKQDYMVGVSSLMMIFENTSFPHDLFLVVDGFGARQ
jgi:hypothetical protein